jgi:serine/threonine protein phosphatase PrpC
VTFLAEPPAVVTVTVLTHRGAERPENEDAVVVGTHTFSSFSATQPHAFILPLLEPVVIAVAVGLGGHLAGEVAAAHTVRRLASAGSMLTSPDAVASTLQAVSAELADMGEQHPDQQGMATTVVGLVMSPERTLWFNVGDSRAYRLTGGYLGQLSVDDSPAAAFCEAGESPQPTAVVTQVLGSSRVAPCVHTGIDPAHGVYLLCSDGLSDLVPVETIERILADQDAGDCASVQALWAAAMDNGGRDNVTVALVRCSARWDRL